MRNKLLKIYLTIRTHLLRIISGLFLMGFAAPGESNHNITNILFIRIDRIGDLVLSTPSLRALRQFYPNARLTVLASPSNYRLLSADPNVDGIIVYDKKSSAVKKLRLLGQIRRLKFDLAIDPHPDYELETALIAMLSRARRKIGYAGFGREFLLNAKCPEVAENVAFVDLTLNVLIPLGIKTSDKDPAIYITEAEKKSAADWIQRKFKNGGKIIGLHPGAYYESQRWPWEYYAELINIFLLKKKENIILFGGIGDSILVKRIMDGLKSDICASVTDDLRSFLSLLQACNVLVCNNSGPLHLAAALNIPTVSFMGPTDKAKWMPYGERNIVFRHDGLACIGCNKGNCKIKNHDCMRLTTPSMAYHSITKII